MRRRDFIKAIAGLTAASPLAAHAQQAAKVPRVGFMGNSTEALEANLDRAISPGFAPARLPGGP